MTIDEAIAHAEAVAQSCDGECAEDHRQLAEWLKELANEQRKVLILMTEANSLRSENDKLRELGSLMDERDVLLPCMFGCNANCRFYSGDMCKRIGSLMRETGIEVDD
jgi:hypothetical protein